MGNKIGKIKLDILYYQAGAIIPGISNFLIIWALKFFLGAEIFGYYSLRMALVLLVSLASVGWLNQSILRLITAGKYKIGELSDTIFLSAIFILILTGIITTVSIYFFLGEEFSALPLIFLALFTSGLNSIIMSFAQAAFQSKDIMVSEGMRAALYLIIAFIFVYYFNTEAPEFLWLSFVVSNTIAIAFLYRKAPLTIQAVNIKQKLHIANIRLLLKYGGPLSIWFLVWHSMNYIEKPYLLSITGNYAKVGNYQAMFDILSKGLLLMILPFSNALFPHITKNFEENNWVISKSLIKKGIIAETIFMFSCLILFYIIGFKIMVIVFNIPDNKEFLWTGMLIIISTCLWQLAILFHRPLELIQKTKRMLYAMVASFGTYLLLMYFFVPLFEGKLYSFVFPMLFSSFVYIGLVSRFFYYERAKI